MSLNIRPSDKSLRSLVKLGVHGHYPLFNAEWFEEVEEESLSLSTTEKRIAVEIFNRMAKHKSLERKRTVLFSLLEAERKIFIKAFLSLVEGQVMDRHQELQ